MKKEALNEKYQYVHNFVNHLKTHKILHSKSLVPLLARYNMKVEEEHYNSNYHIIYLYDYGGSFSIFNLHPQGDNSYYKNLHATRSYFSKQSRIT